MHATIHKKERKVKLVLRQFLFFSPSEYNVQNTLCTLSEAPFSIMIMIKHNKKKGDSYTCITPKTKQNQCITVTISKTKTVLHDITLDYVTVPSIYLHLKL